MVDDPAEPVAEHADNGNIVFSYAHIDKDSWDGTDDAIRNAGRTVY